VLACDGAAAAGPRLRLLAAAVVLDDARGVTSDHFGVLATYALSQRAQKVKFTGW
jgi:hypothetical protein